MSTDASSPDTAAAASTVVAKKPRVPIVINVKQENANGKRCKAQAVSLALADLGWTDKVVNEQLMTSPWSIAWIDVARKEFYAKMKVNHKVNHIPSIEQLTRKRSLGGNLNRMRRAFAAEYDFFPQTWVIPQDYRRLQQYHDESLSMTAAADTASSASSLSSASLSSAAAAPWYIVKPDACCQGKGIFLTDDIADLDVQATRHDHEFAAALAEHDNDEKKDDDDDDDEQDDDDGTGADTAALVVQRYIPQPCLINRRKFDLRIYVLLTSVTPLRAYLYTDGLARFCTSDYVAPTTSTSSASDGSGSASNLFGHITNYALNKRNPDFVDTDDADDGGESSGSKWSLQALFRYLHTHRRGGDNGVDINVLWARITDMIVKMLLSVQPTLAYQYRLLFPQCTHGGRCFQFLGCDVMLDAQHRPYLLECNRNPSLRVDTRLDARLKRAVMTDVLRILDNRSYAAKPMTKAEKMAAKRARFSQAKQTFKQRQEAQAQAAAVATAARVAHEQLVVDGDDCGFQRIYPPPSVTEPPSFPLKAAAAARGAATDTTTMATTATTSAPSEAHVEWYRRTVAQYPAFLAHAEATSTQ